MSRKPLAASHSFDASVVAMRTFLQILAAHAKKFERPARAELRRIPWEGPGPDPRLADEAVVPEPPAGQPTWPNDVMFEHKRAGGFTAYATERQPVPYGSSALLPKRFTAEPLLRARRPDDAVPPPPMALPKVPVALDIDASTGEPRCVGIRAVLGAELTGTLLRTVPVSELVDQATWALARPAKPVRAAPDVWTFERADELTLAQAHGAEAGPRPGSRIPREKLERVVSIYTQALADDDPPVLAVSAELGCSRPHAGRLVMYARAIGLLPPARTKRRQPEPEGGATRGACSAP